ncbi:hypothetical protein Sste5346_007627 [Sporothrix stenoceras]|uniref:Uncharacterized protein n=1 Tax=Sporothrix stenoceras TaxID=5173 RepID=A0ABR3YT34_9PEZI
MLSPHPELRGTRPAKDKYRRPALSSSQPDLEALSDLDPESDSETIKGANDDTVKIDSTDNTVSTVSSVSNGTKSSVDTKGSVEDLTTSLGTLTVIEKTVDKIEFAREQTPEVFVFNSPQTTPVAKKTVETKGKAPEPISKVELPIRTKEDEKSTETQDKALLAASKEDNKPNEKVTDEVS